MIVFFPSWLWLILIPANYLIDRIVLKWSLGDMPDKGMFCKTHNWKVCLAGFLADFAGALVLFAVNQLLFQVSGENDSFMDRAANGIMFNPFSNVLSLIIVVASIALAALCIYIFDRRILAKAGLEADQAKRSALRLALITAPYLYLIPSEWIYN